MNELSSRGIALVVAFHTIVAACVLTIPSSWTWLAGVGIARGAEHMTTGGLQLPPVTPTQVGIGLALSISIWTVLLLIVYGVCICVADLAYFRDRGGFRLAARRVAWSSVWFVIWAVMTLLLNLERGGKFIQPARWPIGETFEARSRLLSLLILFPILWAVGLKPPGSDARVSRRGILTLSYAVLFWILWAGVWRGIPWLSIEAYTG